MATVTRAELQGLAPIDLIVLYLNRINDLDVQKEQVKLDHVSRLEDGTVEATVSPALGSTWVNGPIKILISPINVPDVYTGENLVDFTTIEGKDLFTVLKEANLPPAPPSSVAVEEFDILAEGPHLVISYRLKYTNAFFVGELVVGVKNAPNDLDSLRVLNNLFLGE